MDNLKTIKQLQAIMKDKAATPGEKSNAETLLQQLMDKYGYITDDFDSQVVEFVFLLKEDWRKDLLRQIVAMITDAEPQQYIQKRRDSVGRWRKVPHIYIYMLTNEQYVNVSEAYEVYAAAYETELGRLFGSFVQKHRLYRQSGGTSSLSSEDYAERYGLGGLRDVAKPGTARLSDGS